MNPVVHFEMPYDNAERMARFYAEVFGWQVALLGPQRGNYVVVRTAAPGTRVGSSDAAVGAIGGGFHPRGVAWRSEHPSIVIAVKDIRESMNKVNAAGGRTVGEPTPIPGVGLYVSFVDTENNQVAMMQPAAMQ